MTDNIHLKKKVTLRTKVSESAIVEASEQKITLKRKNGADTVSKPSRGSKKWAAAAAIAGLLAIGGGTYYYIQKDTPPVNQEQTNQTSSEGNEVSNNAESEASSTTDVNESVPGNETTPAQAGGTSESPAQGAEGVSEPIQTDNSNASEKGKTDVGSIGNETSGVQTKSETPKVTDEGVAKNQPANPAKDTGSKPNAPQASQSPTQPASKGGADITSKKPESSSVPTYQSQPVTGSVEQLAADVVFGKYGNNPDRRRLLGDRYEEIQRKVNEMYRTGKFF